MMTVALVVVGAAWLLALLSLALDLAGRPWGRTSRRRSAGGLLMCSGALIDVLVSWPSLPWTVLGFLLILAGASCVLADRPRATKTKPPGRSPQDA